jgi:23S rRNA (adenine2030-N6)-methyltransferase
MRRQDRMVACELEPLAAGALAAVLRGDARAKAVRMDGWTALTAYVPPNERRGLVLVDPPFLLWYPIKDDAAVAGFARKVARLGLAKVLRLELIVASATDTAGLRGAGLIVVNPPWKLPEELEILLPALGAMLRRDGAPRTLLRWLTETAP